MKRFRILNDDRTPSGWPEATAAEVLTHLGLRLEPRTLGEAVELIKMAQRGHILGIDFANGTRVELMCMEDRNGRHTP